MVPLYNIPDLTGFKLKPYVSHLTPEIPEEKTIERKIDFTPEELDELKDSIRKSSMVTEIESNPEEEKEK